MRVLAVGAGYSPTLGGNITMPYVIYAMKILAHTHILLLDLKPFLLVMRQEFYRLYRQEGVLRKYFRR